MAEGILKSLVEKNEIEDIVVESAGTMAPRSMPPTSYTILTMVEMGVDIESHRSRLLTKEMAEASDLIFVMERVHLQFVERLSSLAGTKTFLLKAFGNKNVNGDVEVDDPIGCELDFYRMCGQEIRQEIERILPLILKMAGKG